MTIADYLTTQFAGIAGVAKGGQLIDRPRVPMTFTSTMRQADLLSLSGLGVSDSEQAQESSHSFFGGTVPMTTISMLVNPNSVRFTQPKRFVKRDTREGSVFFHFTNSVGQNNDILTLAMSGNTGIIDLRGSVGTFDPRTGRDLNNGPDTGAMRKWQVWHNLYLLTREPEVFAGNIENVKTITYTSKIFPLSIEFNGFFSKVLEFEENAQKPNSLDYTLEFTVTSTFPSLDDVLKQITELLNSPPNVGEAGAQTTADDQTLVVPGSETT